MTRVTPGNEDITAGLVDFFGRFIPRPEGARTSDDIRGKRPKGTYGQLPPSAKVVTQYPEGVPTGVGGGNAAQSQSQDPEAPAYIPPTDLPLSVPQPAPAPAPAPPTPAPSTGRNDTAPDGSGAKGTNTGFKGYEINLDIVNADSARRGGRGMADVNDFLSEQLPVSPGEKQPQGKQTSLDNDDFILQAQAGGYLDNFMGGTNDEAILHAQAAGFQPVAVYEGVSVPGKDAESPADTADLNRSVSIPGEQEVQKSKPIRGAVDDRFEDGAEYGESYATDYSKSRQARRAAFLDPNVDSSVDAVRNANNAVGIARYGNKFYANDGGTLREIDQSTYDDGRHSKLTAQKLKDGYVEDIKSTLVPADTPDVTDPESKPGNAVDEAVGNVQYREFSINNEPPIGEDTVVDKFQAGVEPPAKEDKKGSAKSAAELGKMASNYFNK